MALLGPHGRADGNGRGGAATTAGAAGSAGLPGTAGAAGSAGVPGGGVVIDPGSTVFTMLFGIFGDTGEVIQGEANSSVGGFLIDDHFNDDEHDQKARKKRRALHFMYRATPSDRPGWSSFQVFEEERETPEGFYEFDMED